MATPRKRKAKRKAFVEAFEAEEHRVPTIVVYRHREVGHLRDLHWAASLYRATRAPHFKSMAENALKLARSYRAARRVEIYLRRMQLVI